MKKVSGTPWDVYRDYVAIKAHYSNPKYDYFKMNGKTRANPKSFEHRRDRAFFNKLAKQKDYRNYIVANVAYNNSWIGDIALNTQADENYKTFVKRTHSLNYLLKTEIKKLAAHHFRDCFLVKDGQHPKLLMMFVNNEISLETASILLAITHAHRYWDKVLADDPLWKSYRTVLIKHERFLAYKKQEVVDIILDNCQEW